MACNICHAASATWADTIVAGRCRVLAVELCELWWAAALLLSAGAQGTCCHMADTRWAVRWCTLTGSCEWSSQWRCRVSPAVLETHWDSSRSATSATIALALAAAIAAWGTAPGKWRATWGGTSLREVAWKAWLNVAITSDQALNALLWRGCFLLMQRPARVFECVRERVRVCFVGALFVAVVEVLWGVWHHNQRQTRKM